MASPGELLERIGLDRVPVLTGSEGDSAVMLSPSDYFLLSRVDGRTPIRTLKQMAAIPADQFTSTFVKILASGLVRVPGVSRTDALDAFLYELTGAYEAVPGDEGDTPEPVANEQEAAEESAEFAAPEPQAVEALPETPEAATDQTSDSGASPESSRAASDSGRDEVEAQEPAVETTESSGSASRSRNNGVSADRGLGSLESFLKASNEGDELPSKELAKPPSTAGDRTYEPARNPAPKANKKSTPKLAMDLVPTTWPVPFDQFTFDPVAMATGQALDDEQKKVVVYYHYHLRRVTYYDLLGIEKGANRRAVKLAYFRLSKAFHPDRWYRQDTGEFGEMIEDVFKWLNRAYGVLSTPRKRKGYDKLISRGYIGEWQLENLGAPKPRRVTQKPEPVLAEKPAEEPLAERAEPSAEEVRAQAQNTKRTTDVLTARARRAAADGDWQRACDLYLRLIEVNATPDLRIRLVECMLKANMDPHEIDTQLSHATQAESSSLSVMLLEAEVARRLDDLQRAEACFRRVIDLEPANPVARLGLERLGAGIPSA